MEKHRIPACADLSGSHFPSSAGDDDLTAVLEEAQKRFSFPKQGAVQFPPAADTSRGVNICNPGAKMPKCNKQSSEKKRLCDKAYRERSRQKREKMENDLVMVGNENEDLKRENGRLRSEKELMDQNLQTRAAENRRLKTGICSLKEKIGHQQLLVDAFSRKLLLANHEDEQLFNLRNENARLHQHVIWNYQMEEGKQLLDRKDDLERQNSLLKIHVQALLEKMYNDKNLEERQT